MPDEGHPAIPMPDPYEKAGSQNNQAADRDDCFPSCQLLFRVTILCRKCSGISQNVILMAGDYLLGSAHAAAVPPWLAQEVGN